jgi:hypothetical protein
MDQPKLRPLFMVVVALAVGGPSCGSDEGGTAAPELRQVLIQVPNATDVDLLAPPDGGVGAVSPVAQIKLVFSQLLDGDKIEDVLDGGGFRGKTDVATLTWMGAPAGAPAITAVTTYNPAGAMGVSTPAPSVLVQPGPGLPSGAMVVLKLARDKLTSKKGTPFTGSDTHMIETEPFAATASFMAGDTLKPMSQINVSFTNVPADGAAAAITVTAGGTAIPLEVNADEMDHRVLVVRPKDGTGWKVGTGYTLAVAATTADLFGVKLPAALSVGFSVAEAGAADGGSSPDGGAPDGGVDAPVDAASDGAAIDAGADAAADSATSG